tara:strand:- start:22 stop:741 length:720 start_codon:yes stop_codon:yes gene_type:complete
MKYITLILIIFSSCVAEKEKEFQLQVGDFLFQDLDSSPLCEAIESVTPGYNNGNFSHVGIIIKGGDPILQNVDSKFEEKYFYNLQQDYRVLEAIPAEVTTTRIDSFLNNSLDSLSNPKVIVGRLKVEYRYLIKDAIRFLNGKIGVKYDDEFLLNNEKYYCSELIYEAFKKEDVFELAPMNFMNKENKIMPIWQNYYDKLNMKVPQGELGINPGLMSISNKIDIIYDFTKTKNFKHSKNE